NLGRHGISVRTRPGGTRPGTGARVAHGGCLLRAGLPLEPPRDGPALARDLWGQRGTMKRVYIETYGCQMNVARFELMFGLLSRAGYVRAEDPAEADVMLVNTCAVRENAEQRVIGRMGELQRHKRPGGVLGVVGCMAQRLGPALLEQVPRVDLVVG